MSVTFQDHPGLRKVSVLGPLESPEEIDLLLSAAGTALPCEINLFDATTLPGAVVEGLARLLAEGHKIKLHAYEAFLVHALTRLGLPVIHVTTSTRRPTQGRLRALTIGGSADSLSRILHLVERLPVGDVAVFVVQHVLEDQRNLLDGLLRVRTEYEVVMPTHLMEVRAGTIYIAPPGHHMKVANGLVYLTRDRKIQYARPSLDALFASVAAEYGEEAVAVLVCGFGRDGVAGCAEIRRKGGTVLLEDPEECAAAHHLPNAVKGASAYDYLLDITGITSFVASLIEGRGRHPTKGLIDLLLEAVHARYGYDFRNYQPGTVERRIEKLIGMLGEQDFFELQREILVDPAVFERFFLEMSINVTSFFRHPEQFRLLREEVLPYLDSFPLIKIWSAGCASGEEVYSLAFLLDELGMLEKSYLFATDMNQHVLRLAEAGLFPASCLGESREHYVASGGGGCFDDFVTRGEGNFLKVPERFKRRIFFHHHSLSHDGVFNEFQLIVCRNVLIYFTPQLQCRVMERFAGSLHRDGFLLLGPSESLITGEGGRFFTPYREPLRCYRRN